MGFTENFGCCNIDQTQSIVTICHKYFQALCPNRNSKHIAESCRIRRFLVSPKKATNAKGDSGVEVYICEHFEPTNLENTSWCTNHQGVGIQKNQEPLGVGTPMVRFQICCVNVRYCFRMLGPHRSLLFTAVRVSCLYNRTSTLSIRN